MTTDREDGKARLLAAVLGAQLEDGSGEGFDADAAFANLRSGRALSPSQKRALVSSPVARARLREAFGREDAALLSRMREHQIDTEIMPLVAASEDQMVTVEAKGWRLTVFREDLPHMAYSLTLQLGDELRLLAPARVKVFDDGGLCWMEGRPDSRAELTSPWTHDGTTPMKRLARHRLRIELLSV